MQGQNRGGKLMVVMGEEHSTRPSVVSLFGLICQLFGYSHNTVALALRPKLRVLY